jgi:hypothetical protein
MDLESKTWNNKIWTSQSGATPAGEQTLVEPLNRQRVLNFLDALYSRDIEGALACCSDDVDFLANAPIDIMPHMGHRRGKTEVREMWRTVYSAIPACATRSRPALRKATRSR